MLGMVVTAPAIITGMIVSLINMPNCYIALALMFFTLFRSLNPFMPYSGPRHRLRLKSNRLNSSYYKPVSNAKAAVSKTVGAVTNVFHR